MKKTSSLSSLLVIGIFVFFFLDQNTQTKLIHKVKTALSSNPTHGEDNVGGGNEKDYDTSKSSKPRTQETIDYYNEIVMNSEFDGRKNDAEKWTEDMKIFVEGNPSVELLDELDRIVLELNEIINPIDIKIVNNRNNANMFIYFGSADGFASKYPYISRSLIEKNWGLFSVGGNSGEMYVDIYRADDLEQKHLLREELTQSLGLYNDSYKYPESIFYQKWTTTTEFAPIDIEIIEMLYNE